MFPRSEKKLKLRFIYKVASFNIFLPRIQKLEWLGWEGEENNSESHLFVRKPVPLEMLYDQNIEL